MTRLANPAAVARFADDNVAHFPNGGGGDSDFSTCKLTLTASNSAYSPICAHSTSSNGLEASSGIMNQPGGEAVDFDVILYKGNAILLLIPGMGPTIDSITLTGDITEITAEQAYLITGDCTMRIDEVIG